MTENTKNSEEIAVSVDKMDLLEDEELLNYLETTEEIYLVLIT